MNIVHQINKTRGVHCRSYNNKLTRIYTFLTFTIKVTQLQHAVLKVHAVIETTSVRKMFGINSKYLIVC